MEQQTTCPSCGKEIDELAERCVYCRTRLQPDKTKWRIKAALCVVLIPAAIIVAFVALPQDHAPSAVPMAAMRSEPAARDSREEPPSRRYAEADGSLAAGARCSGGSVIVENKSSTLWMGTKIEVNGDFVYRPETVPPGENPFYAYLFTKSDGERLNLARYACNSIDIHATVNGERRHWNGARPK